MNRSRSLHILPTIGQEHEKWVEKNTNVISYIDNILELKW